MEAFKKRLINERGELFIKLDKLDLFISDSDVFNTLSEPEKMLLSIQRDTMKTYVSILDARVCSLCYKTV